MPTAQTHQAGAAQAPAVPTPSAERLRRNLDAIARTSPLVAQRIASVEPATDTDFLIAEGGALAGLYRGRALASRRRPLEEASRFADRADVKERAVFVVPGFGLGHHVRALAEKGGKTGAVCVFEPDVALLRAVLERADHSAWLARTNTLFFTDPDGSSELAAATRDREAVFALGVEVLEHAPSKARLGPLADRFGQTFARAVAALRTVVVTTMVQTEVTMRNALMNADHYARAAGSGREGVADLKDLCAGRPAIVVSAGPSLRRSIDLLKDPRVRERCVIVAVQTALKPLLAAGIKPHFVTALDYHEISKRFYEGLTAEDVRGVTLVAEPKANPVILESFPGPVRCAADTTLEAALTPELAGDHGHVEPGATVAHLAYALARRMGCDPVVLTGQDLAFTGGLYYGAGASIHDVWACELGPFRTLETLEWERIVRSRRTLLRREGVDGRPVYSDEQMATYLAQFERLFSEDERAGRTTIDASGGARKAHTVSMTLAEAIEAHVAGAEPLPEIPTPETSDAPLDPARRDALRERLLSVRRDVAKITSISRRTEAMLRQIHERQADQAFVNRTIAKIQRLRDEAHALRPAFDLVQRLNQTGAFNRARADRAIQLNAGATALERQRAQTERDIQNVRWTADAAEALARILEDSAATLDGAPKQTRIPSAAEDDDASATATRAADRRVAALIGVDHDRDSLGRPRELAGALRRTLERLSRCETLDRAILLTDDPERTRAAIGDAPLSLDVDLRETDLTPWRARRDAVSRARRFAPDAWRGGVAGATVFDELVEPRTALAALEGFDAALLVGDDWVGLDPALCDLVVRRRLERPSKHTICFTQAPPGVCGAVVARETIADMAGASEDPGLFAAPAGLLGYMPFKPLPDPIAQPICATIDASVRDRGARATAYDLDHADAPRHLILELTTRRAHRGGQRERWLLDAGDDRESDADTDRLRAIIDAFAARSPGGAVTLAGRGDPLLHGGGADIIRHAAGAGLTVHVRTDGMDGDALGAIVEAGAHVVSVDLLSSDRATYKAIAGHDGLERATANVRRLLAERRELGGVRQPWVVPRITRCDAVLDQIERFYDVWLVEAGAAVIDPLPRAVEGEPCEPLDMPALARRRLGSSTLAIRVDGAAVAGLTDHTLGETVARADPAGFDDAWRAVLAARGLRSGS